MTRALVRFERSRTDRPWLASSVFLATPDRLEGRALPGSEGRDLELARVLSSAEHQLAAHEQGSPSTYEEWVGWAVGRFETGYFSWATEVEPAAGIDELYEREINREPDPGPSLPPGAGADGALPADPVGTPGGLELVEITEGIIFRLERETPERVYGVVAAQDGDPIGLGLRPIQTSFRRDRIVRRTPLSVAAQPVRGTDGSHLRFAGCHGWSLGDAPAAPGPPDAEVLATYPVPTLGWPDAHAEHRDLRALRDRFAGAMLGCAIGDALGGPFDGMSRSEVRAKVGAWGIPAQPITIGGWTDATTLSVELALSLLASGGRLDLGDLEARLARTPWVGVGGGPTLSSFVTAVGAGTPWFKAATGLRADDYGAAVRSGPLGLVHAADAHASRLLTEAVRAALLTHRHHVGVAGAVAVAAATGYLVRLASTGSSSLDAAAFLDFIATAVSKLEEDPTPTRRPPGRAIFFRDRVRRIETWLGREPDVVFGRTWTGAPALESVPVAIYCFLRTPERPVDALRTAVNASHETAAICAMTGTLLGAWLGADRLQEALPAWWPRIPRRDELVSLADRLVDLAGDLAESEMPALTPLD